MTSPRAECTREEPKKRGVWLTCDRHGGGLPDPGRVTRADRFAICPGGDIIFGLENHSFLNIYDLVGRFFFANRVGR